MACFIFIVVAVCLFFKKPHGPVKTGTERQLEGRNYLMVNCMRGELQLDTDMVRRGFLRSVEPQKDFFLEQMNH